MADDRNENNRKTKSKLEPIDDNQQWWLKYVPNSKQWSDMNISRFLNMYKTHPILWDPTHAFYKDQSRRMEAYSIIATRLNLYGIKETECIKLVESLKDLYTKEKKNQSIAKMCSQKYTPPPTWFHMLEELVESVQQKSTNPVRKGCTEVRENVHSKTGSLSVKEDPAKPWNSCCERLYTEDIWTPEHFKRNVMDWFLTSQDEPLLCTCQEFPETNFDHICSTETSSTYNKDSTSNSSDEIYQCSAKKPAHPSMTCCSNIQNLKPTKQCGVDVNNNEMEMCTYQKSKMSSFCNNCAVNNTKICGDEEKRVKMETGFKNKARCPPANVKQLYTNIESCCSEAMYSKVKDFHLQRPSVEETCCEKSNYNNNMPEINKKCKTKKRQQNRGHKLVRCNNSETISKEEDNVSEVCGSKAAVLKSVDGVYRCPKNKTFRSKNTSMPQETCGFKYQEESLCCGHRTELNEQRQCDLKSSTCKSLKSCSEPKKLPEFCTFQTTTCGNKGSIISSRNEITSSTKSHNTCCSDSNKIPVIASENSSRSSILLLECKLVFEKEYSDHRLDYHPDPTLCEKCAVDRIPVRETHRNIMHFQDPRMSELDKYCRYKDWDGIYNIRTQVPDEEPICLIEEESLSMMQYKDEPSRPKRQNHSPTEADVYLFTDPKSSEARQVSLNNEYKFENGLNVKIEQPRHYACEVFEIPGHKPAQLIL